jgi:hypothetical protein
MIIIDHNMERTIMSTQASARYENIAGTETAYDEPANGPALYRASVKRRFQGALTGERFAEVLICRSASDGIGYVASDRFSGQLDERKR